MPGILERRHRVLAEDKLAVRLLNAASERNFCTFPSVDRDPLFDSIRQKDSFKAARKKAMDCQQKFAPATKL